MLLSGNGMQQSYSPTRHTVCTKPGKANADEPKFGKAAVGDTSYHSLPNDRAAIILGRVIGDGRCCGPIKRGCGELSSGGVREGGEWGGGATHVMHERVM